MLPSEYSTTLAIILCAPEKGCTPTLADALLECPNPLKIKVKPRPIGQGRCKALEAKCRSHNPQKQRRVVTVAVGIDHGNEARCN